MEKVNAHITINGEKKAIPTDWSEVTLAQYLKYLEEVEPLLFEENKTGGHLFTAKVISHFTGVDIEALGDLDLNEFRLSFSILYFIFEPLRNFKEFKAQFSKAFSFFIIGGQRYCFPQSLPVPFNSEKLGSIAGMRLRRRPP